jgi:two-component system response regulator NreC
VRTYDALSHFVALSVAVHRIEQRFMPITVLLADDSELVRRAIRRLLMDHPEINLVGEATDFTETMRMIRELRPQIVILDLHMSDSKRITPGEFRSRLNLGKAQLMAISVWNDPETRALAGSYGAANCLDKASLGTHLIPAILHLASPSSESN